MHDEGDFEVMYISPHQGSVRKPTKLTGLVNWILVKSSLHLSGMTGHSRISPEEKLMQMGYAEPESCPATS